MKTAVKIFMFTLVISALFGCNKDDDVKVDNYSSVIVGEWKPYSEEGFDWRFEGETFTTEYYYYTYSDTDIYVMFSDDGYFCTDEGSGTYKIVNDKIYFYFFNSADYGDDYPFTLSFAGKDVMIIDFLFKDMSDEAFDGWVFDDGEDYRRRYGDDAYDYVTEEGRKLWNKVTYHRVK